MAVPNFSRPFLSSQAAITRPWSMLLHPGQQGSWLPTQTYHCTTQAVKVSSGKARWAGTALICVLHDCFLNGFINRMQLERLRRSCSRWMCWSSSGQPCWADWEDAEGQSQGDVIQRERSKEGLPGNTLHSDTLVTSAIDCRQGSISDISVSGYCQPLQQPHISHKHLTDMSYSITSIWHQHLMQ